MILSNKVSCAPWDFAKREVGGKIGLFGQRELPHKMVTLDFIQNHRREVTRHTSKKALFAKYLFKMVRPTGIELVSPAPQAGALSIELWARKYFLYVNILLNITSKVLQNIGFSDDGFA